MEGRWLLFPFPCSFYFGFGLILLPYILSTDNLITVISDKRDRFVSKMSTVFWARVVEKQRSLVVHGGREWGHSSKNVIFTVDKKKELYCRSHDNSQGPCVHTVADRARVQGHGAAA